MPSKCEIWTESWEYYIEKGITDLCHDETKKLQNRISRIIEFLNGSANNDLIKVLITVRNISSHFVKFERSYLRKNLFLNLFKEKDAEFLKDYIICSG